MAGDRARLSYDRRRKYREVVSQQGRVHLEADANEAERLFSEEVRAHALDFVGPHGTPDDGYAVSVPGGTITIGPGTMYVGGIRTTAEAAFTYAQQPDWLDTATPQPWTQEPFRPVNTLTAAEYAMLVLREQEIVAEEDQALRDVALGGPDTAARTRMIQRVVLAPVPTATCEAGATAIASFWSARGLLHDAATAALRPRARLKVGLVTGPPPASPCDPPAASGYLGADNQLIRIQVVAYDPTARTGKLLWAYNNASTLFRCRAATATTIELEHGPVSPEFQPRSGQAVQILLPAADLGEGAFAAALTGHVATLATAYQPEMRRVTLPGALPAVLAPPTSGNPPLLFLRLWDGEVGFTLDAAAVLPGTGLEVTLSSVDGSGPLHLGDHWSIAARPLTPNAVYPQRYLATPQPPDGPRMWASPLAALRPGGATAGGASTGGASVVDCRLPFDNLPELTARQPGEEGDDCCCLTVRPADAEQLQEIIDATVSKAKGAKVRIQMEGGIYRLPKALEFRKDHDGLVLEACTGVKPVLTALDRENDGYGYGLVLLLGVCDVTLRGLQFDVQATRLPEDSSELMRTALRTGRLAARWSPKIAGIGIRIVQCHAITIESCHIRLVSEKGSLLIGTLIQGRNGAITVRDTRHGGTDDKGERDSIAIGLLFAPILANADGRLAMSQIETLTVEDCAFSLLTIGIHLSGDVLFAAIAGNLTRGVRMSFCFLAYRDVATGSQVFDIMMTLAGEAKHAGHPYPEWLLQGLLSDDISAAALTVSLLLALGELKGKAGKPDRAYTLGDMPLDKLTDPDLAFQDAMRCRLDGNRFGSYPVTFQDMNASLDTLIWDLTALKLEENATLIATVTGNTFVNLSDLPTLAVVMCTAFDITGNVVGNKAQGNNEQRARSLIVQPVHKSMSVAGAEKAPLYPFTATGNTCFGLTNLNEFVREDWVLRMGGQASGMLLPMLTWEFFNTIQNNS